MKYYNPAKLQHVAIDYAVIGIKALLLLIIGSIAIKVGMKVFYKILKKRGVEESLSVFLRQILDLILKVCLLISVVGMLGIANTSFVAILGAMGLAVGLSLQGTLSNLSGGVLILFFKPFEIGDLIEAQGVLGEVSEIHIFSTTLITPDHKTQIVPNGALSTGVITNYSKQEQRRVDLTIGIGYGDDIKKAKDVISNVLAENSQVLKDPGYTVAVSNLGDSSVDFVVRPWVKNEDYWNAKFDIIESIKIALDENGISIPFPQRDIHLIKES